MNMQAFRNTRTKIQDLILTQGYSSNPTPDNKALHLKILKRPGQLHVFCKVLKRLKWTTI